MRSQEHESHPSFRVLDPDKQIQSPLTLEGSAGLFNDCGGDGDPRASQQSCGRRCPKQDRGRQSVCSNALTLQSCRMAADPAVSTRRACPCGRAVCCLRGPGGAEDRPPLLRLRLRRAAGACGRKALLAGSQALFLLCPTGTGRPARGQGQ